MAQIEKDPELDIRFEGTTAFLVVTGDWHTAETRPDFASVRGALESPEEDRALERLVIDADNLGSWDTSILTLLIAAFAYARKAEIAYDAGSLPDGIERLFDLATAVPEKSDARRSEESKGFFEGLGKAALSFREGVDKWLEFIGQVTLSMLKLLRGKAQVRMKDFFLILEDTGAKAFPIVTLISFLVGTIIAFLGIVVLVRFNAEYYVSYLVGYGMLREMGAMMTGVILSGRTGAAFAAQIGSMKVNEEIDALRAVGVDPIDFLVLPRVVAMLLMMPLLTIYADVIGILSGQAISLSMQDLAPEIFFKGMLEAVTVVDFLLGLVKSVLFGAIIAMSGCLRGLQSGNDANAVGAATTSAVVTSITLIVAMNSLVDWIAALYNI